MKIFLRACLFLALLTYSSSILSQIKEAPPANIQAVLHGTIIDSATKAPVSGATIQIIGTTHSVISNISGKFEFVTGQKLPFELKITSVGYKTVQEEVTQDNVVIPITQNQNNLNDVVVVGYGTQKKSDITGAISSLDFKQLRNIPQSNTVNILEGRIPGLSVVQTSGQPGDNNSEVSIRGPLNNDLADFSPLILIDGVQATLQDLSNLAPTEIENVSVLKDASSAAIYGARGGNGVILVTTKHPESGSLKLDFNSYYGLQKGTYIPQFVNAWQWMELQNEATGTQLFPQYAIDNVKNGIVNDTFANNNAVSKVFHTAPMSNYNLSLSGGNNKIQYQEGIAYLSQEGIMHNTHSRRINYRSNVTASISKYIQTGLNISGYFQQNHQAYYTPSQVMTQLYRTYPITPDKYSNGTPGVYNLYNGTVIAPADVYMSLGNNNTKIQKSNYLAFIQLEPFKGLTLRSNISYTAENDKNISFLPTYTYSDPSGKPALYNSINTLKNSSTQTNQFQISTTATYLFKISHNDNVVILAGHEYTGYHTELFSASGSDLPNNDQQELDRTTSNFVVGGNESSWRLQSFFGRLNYNFSGRYLFEANIRADGSSRFPETKRYGYFPSVSAGWVISEEKFWKELLNNSSLINFLKLRASYGKTGNDRIGNYSYEQTLDLSNYYYFGSTLVAGAAETNYANSNIQWETTTSKDLGVDVNLFSNKITLSADIYDKVINGLLYTLPLPPSFGSTTAPVQNIAKVDNKGYEIDIKYNGNAGKFRYSIGGNLAYVRNRIADLKGENVINGSNILEEGQDINAFYGYKTDGLYKKQDEDNGYPYYSTGFKLGSLKYVDLNNDGKINDSDRTILGTGSTPYTFGFSGSASYAGFDISFFLQGIIGKSVYTYDWGNRPANAAILQFWKEWWANRYDSTNNPNGTWPSLGRSVPALVSDFYVRNASYVRLKNIELGYSFRQRLLEKVHISSLRLYVSGQNLFTFTPLIHQIDPERAARQSGNSSYPQTKIFLVGLNASF